ncbi:MAG: pimeloyl-ACP methyl ester carboxylesterase [Patiriisocius sp.]|jgi:pimeloyl-ACP methyl ester carboxylesterase
MEFLYQNKSIFYELRGRGQTTLLLHGYMETVTMWDFLTPQLSEHGQVLAIDLPGHGGSEMLEQELSMENMAMMVKALLDNLQIDSVSVCGHSMGGYVALSLADLYPKLVSKLVLYHSTAFSDSEQIMNRRKIGIKLLEEAPKTAIKASFAKLFHSHEGFEEHITFYISEALKGDFEAYKSCNIGMANRKDLGEVLYYNRPTFIIAGRKDPVVREEDSQKQMNFLGPNDSFWLEKSGHMSYVEEMELSRSILLAILP